MKTFIDDVTMSVGGNESSFKNLIQQAQTQLQWWTQLIQASSSALNPQKCCCTIYTWHPDTSGILQLSTVAPNDTVIVPCPQQHSR